MDCGRVKKKAIAVLLLLRLRQRKTRIWVHPMNQRRSQFGAYYHLVSELRIYPKKHLQYFRMSAEKMEQLLSIIGPTIRRQETNYRRSVCPSQRLAVTLRFLASGEGFTSLAFQYRLGVTTVARIVQDTLEAIEKLMLRTQIPRPTEDSWRSITAAFWEKWNFPNCIGAIDGKHINIRAPPNSGSLYYNYKHNFSIVLMALVDANYRFTYIHVGHYGRASDGGIFAASNLKRGMENNTLHVPQAKPLPGAEELGCIPHLIVGDAAFPLKPYAMRPFGGTNLTAQKKAFNYRLSRARMVVECAFGIMAARWRVLLTTIALTPQHVDSVIISCCILHNFLSNSADNQMWLAEARDRGLNMHRIQQEMEGRRASEVASSVRDKLCTFFSQNQL